MTDDDLTCAMHHKTRKLATSKSAGAPLTRARTMRVIACALIKAAPKTGISVLDILCHLSFCLVMPYVLQCSRLFFRTEVLHKLPRPLVPDRSSYFWNYRRLPLRSGYRFYFAGGSSSFGTMAPHGASYTLLDA